MEYYYKIYGLIIKSELELPEAYEIDKQLPEVEIKFGTMPEQLKKDREANYNLCMQTYEYKWFYLKNEGNFLIEKGTSITIELDSTANAMNTRMIVLGNCLGSILYQRGIISLHGSAVVWKDKTIIISGRSGAGKSTISTELRRRGCLFVADDTVALTNENGIIYAHPAYPMQKLCTNAAIEFGYDLNKLYALYEDSQKYAVRLTDTFCLDKEKINSLICLETKDVDQVVYEEVTGSSKVEYIINNLYTYFDYNFVGMRSDIFRKCLYIAQKIPIIRIIRPLNKNTKEQIADYLIDQI